MTFSELPIAVIGGGPIGLAAAAHLQARGLPVKLYEAGGTVGASVRDWGHVRVFSPWKYNIDPVARALLQRHGWQMPEEDGLPTGEELYRNYLQPLAATPELAPTIETRAKVQAISRLGIDKITTRGREGKPFRLQIELPDGAVRQDVARAVVDASGTWTQPNPMGASGLAAEGESERSARITYGIPDVLGRDRATYAGRRTLVIGAGYSAANVLLDLVRLAQDAPGTQITWVVRGNSLVRVYGGGLADQLPARGALGWRLKELVDQGSVRLVTGFATVAVRASGEQVLLEGETGDGLSLLTADRIVVATGQRPDLAMTRELRLELDPWLESVRALGPLIDPNLHSCGSVPPHGHRELSHPEPGFYTIGVKSYGRAPTFLLMTGYEQARSVAAALSGDVVAADDVQLVLPETGICSADNVAAEGDASGCCGEPAAKVSSSCCGGPAPVPVSACCVADARDKAEGKSGCGCGSAT